MNQKHNIAIIGAGMVAGIHLEAIRKTRAVNVLWLADIDKKVLAEKQKKYNVPNVTADYREILDDKNVDAVIVAVPPYLHFEAAVAAMNAGKNVLIEKPLAADRSQMNQLVEESEKHKNLVILECSARHARLQPKFKYIKNMLDNGDIGQIYHIHHNHLMRRTFIEYNPRGGWSLKKTLAGGGPFLDWGVYDLSFHLGLLDDRPKIAGMKKFIREDLKILNNPALKSDVEEHGGALMEFDTGLTYYYERGAGVHCEIANETRIFGTKGSLRFSYTSWDSPQVERFWVDKNGVEKCTNYKINLAGHTDDNIALTNHFIDCLDGKAKPAMPVSLAAKHLDILFQILDK